MNVPRFFCFALVHATIVLATCAKAAIVYDESVNGGLSSDNTAPTTIATAIGSNVIKGSVNESGSKLADFWTITIAAGQQLDQIVFQDFGPVEQRTFFAIEFGEQISDIFVGTGLAGGDHIGIETGTTVGNNVLDDLAAGVPISAVGSGFTTPLTEGTYSFWFQEGSEVTSTFDYEFDFRISRIGDFNTDGSVTGEDFLVWQVEGRSAHDLQNWSLYYGDQSLSAAHTIPEPNTLTFISIIVLFQSLSALRFHE